MTIAPSTSLGKLESTFCRDFSCCGQDLEDLHDLLQHYEECHVRFDDDTMPGMIEDDDSNSSGGSVSTPSSVPPSPRGTNAKAVASSSKLPNGVSDSSKKRGIGLSADGSSAMDPASAAKGKKRSFGQYDAGVNGSVAGPGANVHQSLRRALIDGGVGSRSNRSTPSVYSANSPFSTPGSSIPGTPIADDHEFAFGGPSGLSAFSAMSLRPSNTDDHLPACAPPNLFFPAPGSASGAGANATTPGHPALNLSNLGGAVTVGNGSSAQPPAKRERITSSGSTGAGSEKLDRDGKVIEKPFKCPNPGCDKAYKQANGLKYHRLHGSCNRNLASKGTATPTPGTPTPKSPATNASPSTPLPSAATPIPSSNTANTSVSTAAPHSAATPLKPAVGAQQQGQVPRPVQGQAPNASAVNNANKPPINGVAKPGGVSGAPSKPSLPLPAHINSAALAAAAALLQRGGPLPASLQGQNGPIDTASLLKTLQVLQQQMAAQQGGNNANNVAAGSTTANKPQTQPQPRPTGPTPGIFNAKGNVAPGAPTGASLPTTATSGGGSALSKTAPSQPQIKPATPAPSNTATVKAPATVSNPSTGPNTNNPSSAQNTTVASSNATGPQKRSEPPASGQQATSTNPAATTTNAASRPA